MSDSESELLRIPVGMVEITAHSNFYCWICKKSNTNLRCTKCERQFHQECVKNYLHIDCSDNGDFKKFDKRLIPKILNFIKADVDQKFDPLMKLKFTKEQTQNPIDFSKMQQKLYESVERFEEDLKWFVHNCCSIHPENEEVQEACEGLIQNVKQQIETIKACTGCYRNLNEFYVNVSVKKQCSKLHVLLWAKAQDHDGYLPARVLAVNFREKTVYIQYFGDYSCFPLPINDNNCYLYSTKYPGEKKDANSPLCVEAQRDVFDYSLDIYYKYHNHFNYAKCYTAFEPENWKEYLKLMVAKKPSTGWYTTNELETDSSEDSTSDSEFNEIEFKRTRNSMRKRNASRSSSLNGRRRVKRSRILSYTDESDQADELDAMENGCIDREALNETLAIGNLNKDLGKNSTEKQTLGQQNANLTDEKNAPERKIASLNDKEDLLCQIAALKESQRKAQELMDMENKALKQKIDELDEKLSIEKKWFDDEKKAITEQYIALENEKNTEKKAHEEETRILMEKNAALEKELKDRQKDLEEVWRRWKEK